MSGPRKSVSRPRLGLFSLRAVIFQGGLHQCPSEKGAKASRLLASTSRSLVTSRLTLPANAGLLRLLPPKTPVRETHRRRKRDSNPRSPQEDRFANRLLPALPVGKSCRFEGRLE